MTISSSYIYKKKKKKIHCEQLFSFCDMMIWYNADWDSNIINISLKIQKIKLHTNNN